MPASWFKDCEYSAFISYAHADDRGWNHWVTCFSKELEMTLPSRLRISQVPKLHLSGKNGPIAGDLGDELRDRIAQSFVMIVVVHEQYAVSGWCQKELEYFKSLFGDKGFRERLYIIALSKPAIEDLTRTPEWKALSPNSDLVWMPFYQEDNPDMPIVVYSDKGIVANAFWTQFVRLREDLARKIKNNVDAEINAHEFRITGTGSGSFASSQPNPPPSDDIVRMYIESNQREVDHWEAVGSEVMKNWDGVTADMAIAPPLYLRPTGLPIDRIDQHPRLDDADGVILLWGQKTPDSLVAQIGKVERKLPARELAPCIVAYLMPPQDQAEMPVPAWRWRVLRFNDYKDGRIEVVAQDAPALADFLRKAIKHKRQCRDAAAVTLAASNG